MATTSTPYNSAIDAIRQAFPGAALAITPHDTNVFERPVAVYVGVAGDVVIRPANGGSAVTFKGMAAGSVVPCMAIGVNSTSTTATNLVAIY